MFTIEDIETAWDAYDTGKAIRILKGGKWEVTPITPGKPFGKIEGTRAEIVPLYKAMPFPEYLKGLK